MSEADKLRAMVDDACVQASLALDEMIKRATEYEYPNVEGWNFIVDDVRFYGDSVRPFAVPVSSGEAIPDFGEPKKFL